MEDSLKQRAAVAVRSLGKRGRTTRIPDPVRRAVVAYAERARASGRSWKAISQEVGLSASLLVRWHRGPRKTPAPGFIPVRIAAAAAAPSRLVLITPGGHRIEGLDTAQAIELLRQIG